VTDTRSAAQISKHAAIRSYRPVAAFHDFWIKGTLVYSDSTPSSQVSDYDVRPPTRGAPSPHHGPVAMGDSPGQPIAPDIAGRQRDTDRLAGNHR
jgi:hypothetical protein